MRLPVREICLDAAVLIPFASRPIPMPVHYVPRVNRLSIRPMQLKHRWSLCNIRHLV